MSWISDVPRLATNADEEEINEDSKMAETEETSEKCMVAQERSAHK